MAYIYLTESEAKYFFLNKYLQKKHFDLDKKPRKGFCSFRTIEDELPFKTDKDEVVFLSQFLYASIPSEKDIVNFNRNYDVPMGFLEVGKSGSFNKITGIDNLEESEYDNVFMAFRNGFLHSFNKSRTGKKSYEHWFEKLNTLNFKSILLLKRIIAEILKARGFPQVQVTADTAKNTKIELQFIFFGRLLAQIYFPDNDGKTDEEHRNWLMSLNPTKDMSITQIPSRFKEDVSIIIAYLLNLKISSEQLNLSDDQYRDLICDLKGFTNSGLSVDGILFYTHFIQGIQRNELSRIFHTNSSQRILTSIERKAYQLANEYQVFQEVPEDIVQNIWKLCSENTTPKSQIFSDYSLMLSGEKAKERTEEEILQKIEPFNLLGKEVLLFFFKHETSLEYLWGFLQSAKFIKKVLLIYKQANPSEEAMHNDFSTSSIRAQFEKKFRSVEFEIVVKVMANEDDKEIKNNIKGFLSKHLKESNLLYWSDATGKETRRENLWIATAFSKTPIFSVCEDYLFIS